MGFLYLIIAIHYDPYIYNCSSEFVYGVFLLHTSAPSSQKFLYQSA